MAKPQKTESQSSRKLDVNLHQAGILCKDVLIAGLVPALISSPGLGKSALAKMIAKEFRLYLIDVRLSYYDPADLNGFPMILKPENQLRKNIHNLIKAGYIPMEVFPIMGDELPPADEDCPEGYLGWLILLDEFNSAPIAVQAATYKLVLDKMVGMHKLHKNVALMMAGNRKDDKAIVKPMSTAFQSRHQTIYVKADLPIWMEWADSNDIDYRVKAFLNLKPDYLHKFSPDHKEANFPCPRTWEFMSKTIKPWKELEKSKLPLLAGTVGEGVAREFHVFTKIFRDIPDINQIKANPDTIDFGTKPSVHHALAGLVSYHMTETNADILMPFVHRLGIDFQANIMRAVVRKDRRIKKAPAVIKWIAKNTDEYVP